MRPTASQRQFRFCGGPRCAERGSIAVKAAFEAALAARNVAHRVTVSQPGAICHGRCQLGPNLLVSPDNVWYGGVSPTDAVEIVERHVIGGAVVERLRSRDPSFLDLDAPPPWMR